MIPFPNKKYNIIYADPPWPYYGDPNKDQAAGKHFKLMSLEDIKALPVREIVAEECLLFLWVTCPKDHVRMGYKVLRAWGFEPEGIPWIWAKTAKDGHIINGQGIRPRLTKATCELVLAGTTDPNHRVFPILNEGMAQLVPAPRPGNRHSAKPPIIRDYIVELLGDRPRIELFARECVEGWDAWGDEV